MVVATAGDMGMDTTNKYLEKIAEIQEEELIKEAARLAKMIESAKGLVGKSGKKKPTGGSPQNARKMSEVETTQDAAAMQERIRRKAEAATKDPNYRRLKDQ